MEKNIPSPVTFPALGRIKRKTILMRPTPSRTLWLDYLRSGTHGAGGGPPCFLAYTSFASFHPEAYILSTHPVVDTYRWIGSWTCLTASMTYSSCP